MRNTFLSLVVMSVFGLASLGVVGWLMHLRMGQPAAEEFPLVGTAGQLSLEGDAQRPTPPSAFAVLASGSTVSMRESLRALAAGDRAAATHALDAALRVTGVGEAAARGDAGSFFSAAHRAVQQARHALQNGRPDGVREALVGVAGLGGGRFPGDPQPAEAGRLARYEGATVVDPRGVRIGEIEGFDGAEGAQRARLRLGGWQDFMGLVDLGGEELRVPAGRLVFGPAPGVGDALVVLLPEREG